MITHYDLFAGIGGFSLALDEVFYDRPIRHIFCEWEHFPAQVLKKHWPDGEYWGDIADLVAHTKRMGFSARRFAGNLEKKERKMEGGIANAPKNGDTEFTIVTGGFPCQPFSAAGQRRGTADDRYKWPEMFEVIRNISPDWVIAENVRGLVNWSDGMVLEQVCSDLESIGYEVWPLVIPAVAVNAPHRRDRVWILAKNTLGQRRGGRSDGDTGGGRRKVQAKRSGSDATDTEGEQNRGLQQPDTQRYPRAKGKQNVTNARHQRQTQQEQQTARGEQYRGNATDSSSRERQSRDETQTIGGGGQAWEFSGGRSWGDHWPEVAAELCVVDDGLSSQLVRLPDGTKISYPKWRKESLKAGGNAIVPQVAIEILKALRASL